MLGLITGLGLFELYHNITKPFELGILVFFTNLDLMKYQVKYLVLFLLFSVIGHFGWFWMESLHKNIQLTLEFLKHPFLVPHFFYQAWKFGRNNYFVTASFLLLMKEDNDNSFPLIHLHNKEHKCTNLTGKHFYNLAYKLHFLHTDLPMLHKQVCFSTTIPPLSIY